MVDLLNIKVKVKVKIKIKVKVKKKRNFGHTFGKKNYWVLLVTFPNCQSYFFLHSLWILNIKQKQATL